MPNSNLIPLPNRRSTEDLRAEMRELCLGPRTAARDSRLEVLEAEIERRAVVVPVRILRRAA